MWCQVQSDHSEFRIIKLGKDNAAEHMQLPYSQNPIKQQESFVCCLYIKPQGWGDQERESEEQNFETGKHICKETTS